jgi:hypothetical protein
LEDVGGFFAVLKMQTDDASFAKGGAALGNIATILKGFALLKIGEGMMQLLAAMGKINEQQALLNTTSAEIGISTVELKNWQIMADMVGGSADGMASSLKGLMDITANLGRGITPDNQKFIDMLGVLGVTKWQGVSSTELAQNMLDNAMTKIRQYQQRGDKVGEARTRNAIEEMLGPSGNAIITAGLLQGWTTQQMLQKSKAPLMTTAGQMQGAVGPMVDLKLFNSTVKEAENLFAMQFMAKVDPALKDFLSFIMSNKGEITTTLTDLANVFGFLASKMLASLKMMVEGAMFADQLFHGKIDKTVLSEFGEAAANLLIPKAWQDRINSDKPLFPLDPRLTGRGLPSGHYGPFGYDSKLKVSIEATPELKRLINPRTSGIRQVNDAADMLFEHGG